MPSVVDACFAARRLGAGGGPGGLGARRRRPLPTAVDRDFDGLVHGTIFGFIDAMPWERAFCEQLFSNPLLSKATSAYDDAYQLLYVELTERGVLPLSEEYDTVGVGLRRPDEEARAYFLRLCRACSRERKTALDRLRTCDLVAHKRDRYGNSAEDVVDMLADAKHETKWRLIDTLTAILLETWGECLDENTSQAELAEIASAQHGALFERTMASLSPRLLDDLGFLEDCFAIGMETGFPDWRLGGEFEWSERLRDRAHAFECEARLHHGGDQFIAECDASEDRPRPRPPRPAPAATRDVLAAVRDTLTPAPPVERDSDSDSDSDWPPPVERDPDADSDPDPDPDSD